LVDWVIKPRLTKNMTSQFQLQVEEI